MKNRENILKAHRSHLYQRLVIAGRSHLEVTLVYGGLAIVNAVLGLRVLSGAEDGEAVTAYSCARGSGRLAGEAVGVVVLLFVVLWRWTVVTERRAEKLKS